MKSDRGLKKIRADEKRWAEERDKREIHLQTSL